MTAASGLQVKNPSKKTKSVGSLEVFTDSAAGALPAIWAKLPQSLEGENFTPVFDEKELGYLE